MPNYEQIIAGDPPYGGDSGQQFANKINGNFSETNNALSSLNTSIGNVNTTLGNRLTTVENNKMDKSNPVGSGSFSINRKTGSAIGTNSFVAGGTDNIASSPNQHVQGRYNVEDSSSVYADIIGNGTADDNRKNIEATDWNGNKHLKGDVYVGCNDDSSGGTKLVKNGDSITDLEEDSTHRTVTDTEKTTWNNKQDALVFDAQPSASNKVVTLNNPVIQKGTNPDTEPTENSTKFVESGGIKTYVDKQSYNENLLVNPYFHIRQLPAYIIPTGTTYYAASDTSLTTPLGTTTEPLNGFYQTANFGYVQINNTLYCIPWSADYKVGYGENGVGFDFWHNYGTVRFLGDTLGILLSRVSVNPTIAQMQPRHILDTHIGEKATVSVKIYDTIYSGTVTIPARTNSAQWVEAIRTDDFRVHIVMLENTNDRDYLFRLEVINQSVNEIEISAAKFEFGEKSTLYKDIKSGIRMNKDTELLKCLPFRVVYESHGWGHNIATIHEYNSTDTSITFFLPLPIRVNSMVKIWGFWRNSHSGSATTIPFADLDGKYAYVEGNSGSANMIIVNQRYGGDGMLDSGSPHGILMLDNSW